MSGQKWRTLEWKRIDAGEYESEDGRFHITKTWDRLYGNHWELQDSNVEDWYKSKTACDSLKHAKHVAEVTVNRENGVYEKPPILITNLLYAMADVARNDPRMPEKDLDMFNRIVYEARDILIDREGRK